MVGTLFDRLLERFVLREDRLAGFGRDESLGGGGLRGALEQPAFEFVVGALRIGNSFFGDGECVDAVGARGVALADRRNATSADLAVALLRVSL